MTLKKLIKLTYAKDCTMTCGKKGHGKDMLYANVINCRNEPYISNTNYHCNNDNATYIELDISKLNCNNDYHNFVTGKINKYVYPYPHCADIYISDCGVYFPSQYDTKLDKEYPYLSTTFALFRQVSKGARIHCNSQALCRIYKKLREQQDVYILCNWCKVFFGKYVIQKITIYDRYNSCEQEVEPYLPIKIPMFASKELKANLKMKNEEMLRLFKQNYGSVKSHILIYKNKSNYDTNIFKTMLENGE